MANSIALATKYIPLIDEIYAKASTTSVLERPDFVRYLSGANAVEIMKIALQGLGDYSRSGGYANGDITASWETHTLSQDRGRRFILDAMDNEETLGLTLGAAMSEFQRTKVAPEVDAYRFAILASKAATSPTGATLDASTAKTAVDTAMAAMKELSVDLDGGFLFCTPTVKNFLKGSSAFTYNLDATKVNPRDQRFNAYDGLTVIEVPQTRFYTAITQYDGTTSGEEAGGYIKNATTGKDINFMIVAANSCLPVVKHNPSNIITPDANQTGDGYIMKYRTYHDLFVPDNKVNGVYLHKKA